MIPSGAVTAADLRPIDLFDGIDDGQLADWVAAARELCVPEGTVLAEESTTPLGLLLLVEGIVQTQLLDGDRVEPTGRHHAPTWMGAISVLTGEEMKVRLRADTPCRLAVVDPAEARRLVFAQRPVLERVMAQIAPVMRRVADNEAHRERLASLGTMAAGLTHELNNPAAAARRTAAEMAELLDVISSAMAKFVESGVEREEAAQLVALQQQAVARAATCTALDALDASDAEDELLDRLEALGVDEPWRIAEPLSAARIDAAWLDQVAALAGPATGAALRWVAATLTAGRLAAELQDSTERISKLVGAVKSYAAMDRGGMDAIDLHEGLESTLVILAHKLKQTSIAVVREYDRSLPHVTVNAGELNQVWTNLIDNAIDALGERGTITVTTRRDGDWVEIVIGDDGPGFSEEIARRVFDPFFTTKEAGSGTGLGLATARRIVVDRHNGSLSVRSEPGDTAFVVRLPLT